MAESMIERGRIGGCPLEREFAAICARANIQCIPHDAVSGLDFYLPELDTYVEIKRYHSERISKQMARQQNVICIQGAGALMAFSCMVGINMSKDTYLTKATADQKTRLRAMSDDDLHSERKVLSHQANMIFADYNKVKSALRNIKDELARRKNPDGPVISDHAVLRYLERHMGVDTVAVRATISEIAKARIAEKKRQIVKSGTMNLAMEENRVCTFWDDKNFGDAILSESTTPGDGR